MPPMESSYTQQGLDSRYGAQTDLIGLFYLPDVFIDRALHWLQLLLHLQCLAGLNVSFLLEGLDRLR